MMPETRRSWWIRKCLLGGNLVAPVLLVVTRFQSPTVIGATLLLHAAFIYSLVRPSCSWFGPVVTRFRPHGRQVWLTIDDGPAGADSEELAAEMQRRGVRATFFVKGRNLLEQTATAHCLLAAGHTLANHTQTHSSHLFWALWPSVLRREIDACQAALHALGVPLDGWFRSPVGLKHPQLHPTLRARGLRLIGWSVRGKDGITCDPEAVARRVREGVCPGAIILLHEGRPRSNEAILRVIDELLGRGFSFVIPADEQLL